MHIAEKVESEKKLFPKLRTLYLASSSDVIEAQITELFEKGQFILIGCIFFSVALLHSSSQDADLKSFNLIERFVINLVPIHVQYISICVDFNK